MDALEVSDIAKSCSRWASADSSARIDDKPTRSQQVLNKHSGLSAKQSASTSGTGTEVVPARSQVTPRKGWGVLQRQDFLELVRSCRRCQTFSEQGVHLAW